MRRSKKIRLFAGPNGSGKTTLYLELSQKYNCGDFINADMLEKQLREVGLIDIQAFNLNLTQENLLEFAKTPNAVSLLKKAHSKSMDIKLIVRENCLVQNGGLTNSYESAFAAAFLREALINKGKTFSFETVMSHRSKLDEIQIALKHGYNTYLYFVCLDDPEMNIDRVENRVNKGGHPVEKADIISRYDNTLKNLYEAILLSYRAYLFDNSGKEPKMIAEYYNGALELKVDNLPNWFIKYVLPHFTTE